MTKGTRPGLGAGIDDFLIELAKETATELERRALHEALSQVNERDHLQPSCVSASRALAARWMPPPEVESGLRFHSGLWPRLGRVDVAVAFPGGKPVAVELKCGRGRDTLGPCAWDALKLAFALQIGEASACYLLAALPTSDWTSEIRGAELFETRSVDTLALRERFLDWWRHWERLGDPTPGEVPRRFRTRAVARVPFEIDGRTWELRLAALALESDDRIAWRPAREPTTL